MTGELEPLDSDLAALLDAERARPAGSPEAMERVFTRVEASIGALPPSGGGEGPGGDGGGGDGSDGAGNAPGSPVVDGANAASSAGAAGAGLSATGAGIAGAKLALFTGAIFALGLGAGAGLHATFGKEPAPRVEVVEKIVEIPVVMRPDPAAPKPDPEEPAAPPPEPNEALVPSGSTTTPKTTGAPSTIDPATSSAGRERDRQLSEENLLIARAQAALARQDVRGALDALHLHAARFPQGQMRPERELMLREAQRLDKATP
jgi:hypothetical protein